MSIIAHAQPPEQDEFATRAVINLLTNAARPYEDNLRRNRDLASGHLQQRIVNRIHALVNGLEQELASEQGAEAAA